MKEDLHIESDPFGVKLTFHYRPTEGQPFRAIEFRPYGWYNFEHPAGTFRGTIQPRRTLHGE